MPDPVRRIATYARVSSDEQRDRHTVLNQRAALDRRLSSEPGLHVFKHYEDDGVSGTVPLEDRPGGGVLVRDARARRFSQVWVVRADRLGRDAFELLRIWRTCEALGVALRATDENIEDPFSFDIHAVIAANERRKFLERSAEGMNRAAKRGPLYRRHRPARLYRLGRAEVSDAWSQTAPSCGPISPPPTWSGASITISLADGWSCACVSPTEFNSLGIPTVLSAATAAASEVKSHPGRLALGPYPQPRRQYRLHGLTPVRPQVFQTQWPVPSSPLPSLL